MANISELKALASVTFGFARSNNFLVELPFIPGIEISAFNQKRNLNLLCKNVSLPGQQILTADRVIGMQLDKVAYGYAVPDVTFSFYAMNDYFVRKYLDQWLSTIVNPNNQVVGYKKSYAQPVKIHQLRKPQVGLNANAGPIQVNVGAGGGTVYSVELEDAFPTTVNSIDFSNDLDGLVEVSVQLSYTKWRRIEPSQNFINVNIGV